MKHKYQSGRKDTMGHSSFLWPGQQDLVYWLRRHSRNAGNADLRFHIFQNWLLEVASKSLLGKRKGRQKSEGSVHTFLIITDV